MQEVNTLLREYINEKIIPQYTNFDKGHNIDHVNDVITQSLKLAQAYDVDIDMVFVIAAYHDIGIKLGRKNHNIISAQLVSEDKTLKKWFSPKQIIVISQAIEDHRASNDYEPRSIYGKIVSEADRFIDVESIIYRTMEYGKSYYPDLNLEEQFERMYTHIKDKYGENGYLKLWLSTERNSEGLKKLRNLLKDKEKMKKYVVSVFN